MDGAIHPAREEWGTLSVDERHGLIDLARRVPDRSYAFIGPYRMYQDWVRTNRLKAADGDFDAYLLLRREFYCSSPDRLRGHRLYNLVLHEAYDHRVWRGLDIDLAVRSAKAFGTWRSDT